LYQAWRRHCPRGRRFSARPVPVVTAALIVAATVTGFAISSPAGAALSVSVGPIVNVSAPCSGQNAEVAQAVGPVGSGDVYESWTGCNGIGYARSTNGGANFSPAVTLPGSAGSPGDPAMAVAADGTLYVAFMMFQGGQNFPVVDASFDNGATFPQVTPITAPDPFNWGDSPNIAVGPDGSVYVTYDYGPSSAEVDWRCNPHGSCGYLKGDLNVVIQKSTDRGATFGTMVPISPGYPWSGAENGPIVVTPTGVVDVVFQDYPTVGPAHLLKPALNYFSSSADGGTTWSTPVAIGPTAGRMSLVEWWNEPGFGIDAGGNLYVSWDTQQTKPTHTDIGWLSFSENNGTTWSTPVQAPADQKAVPHIMQVVGAASGHAYVAWLSDSNIAGYTLFLRPFSISGGWQGPPVQLSTLYGARTIWPGDTFGLSIIDPSHVMTSWGSGLAKTQSSVVYATQVTL
jgi:hypothetical protein